MALTWRTGPILVCPRIHPISSESWSRDNVYSLHDPAFPPEPSFKSWMVRKYCSTETFLMNPADSHIHLLIFEFLLVITQSISRCLNIRLKCLYQRIRLFKLQFSILLLIHFHNGFLHAWKWLTKNLLSQFITPVRGCSVDTELICRIDRAKWTLCVRKFRTEVVRTSPTCLFHDICSRIPLSFKWEIFLSLPVLFFTETEKRPMSQRKFLCMINYHFRIRKNIPGNFILGPIDVVEHQHEDDPIFKLSRSCFANGHSCLNLAENFHSSVSWEKIHSNSNGSPSNPNNSVHQSESWKYVSCSFHFTMASGGLWISSKTKNCIWIDVYLCFWQLNHFVMSQSISHPGR